MFSYNSILHQCDSSHEESSGTLQEGIYGKKDVFNSDYMVRLPKKSETEESTEEETPTEE